MTVSPLALVLGSVFASSVAQVAFKKGMSELGVQAALGAQSWSGVVVAVASNWYVLCGLVLYAASVPLWLLALSKVDISLAYPFVAIGIVVTFILAATLLGEPVGSLRIAGSLLVVAGVAMVAHS